MLNNKTLLSIAVAASLGAMSLSANAAGPTVYGDIAVALVSTGSAAAGGDSDLGIYDNVSLLGVKGDAAVMGTTKFIYDFNFILNQITNVNVPLTHLSTIGLDGDFGTAKVGLRENGLFCGMVDCGTYQTNWFYTTGMSALQVSDALTYISKESGGLQFGVQAFDIGKQAESTMNLTVAGTYAMKALSFGAGFTSYSDYGDKTSSTKYTTSGDTSQFGTSTNTFAGQTLKSTIGLTAGFKQDKFGVTGAYDMRKPNDGNPITDSINTLMVTGSFSVSKTTTLVANVSNTSQSSGAKGTVITLMGSVAPADNLFFSVELQSCNSDANTYGLESCPGGGTDSTTSLALGATYSF